MAVGPGSPGNVAASATKDGRKLATAILIIPDPLDWSTAPAASACGAKSMSAIAAQRSKASATADSKPPGRTLPEFTVRHPPKKTSQDTLPGTKLQGTIPPGVPGGGGPHLLPSTL